MFWIALQFVKLGATGASAQEHVEEDHNLELETVLYLAMEKTRNLRKARFKIATRSLVNQRSSVTNGAHGRNAQPLVEEDK